MFRRALISGLLVGFAVGVGSAAYAGQSTSAALYYGPVGGYSYHNWSTLQTNFSSDAKAIVSVSTNGGSNAPANYIGAEAFLYQISGGSSMFCKRSGLQRNGSATSFFQASTVGDCGPGQYRNQQSYTQAYKPAIGGYIDYYAYWTDILTQSN
jgi:hypothetical protein